MTTIENIKTDLISQIDKRVEDKIIEPANAELLKKLILRAETANEAMMIAELGTTYKRTGFHFDKRLEKLGSDIKYLKKNEKLSFQTNPNALTHKLIIGDNYDALQQLLITHKGKIDVIYIDPPYGCNDMGEFAKTNYTNGITRDNLLSMLYPRLQLARQLLSEEGVIFCSIDDKNQAYVKGLFDEVFGEENFIENFIWIKNSTKNNSKTTSTNHEYVLCYAKSKITIMKQVNLFKIKKQGIDEVNKILENAKKNNLSIEETELALKNFYNNHQELKGVSQYKKVEITTRSGQTHLRAYRLDNVSAPNGNGPTYEIIHPITHKPCKTPSRGWSFTWQTMQKLLQQNLIYFGKDENTVPQYKRFLDTVMFEVPKSIIFDNNEGKWDLQKIFNVKNPEFNNPKSLVLIKKILELINNKNAIVLDFFAGSGTTGQAVLELNREDGGNRQFILCTNNEKTDMNPNGIAYDVTSKRLKRVMTGECYDGTNDFPWIQKNEPYGDNLDVFEIENVNSSEQTPEKSPFDVIDETCYDIPKFNSIQEKTVWICNNFENTQKYIKEERRC